MDSGLSADELNRLRDEVPGLFSEEPVRPRDRDVARAVPAEEEVSEAEVPDAAVDQSGPVPAELKTRADSVMARLEEALMANLIQAQGRSNEDSFEAFAADTADAAPSRDPAPLRAPVESPNPILIQRKVRDTVKVPVKLRGTILGKGGSHIRELEERYDVLVDVPRARSESLEETMAVVIRGLEENVDACAAAIQRMCHQEVAVGQTNGTILG